MCAGRGRLGAPSLGEGGWWSPFHFSFLGLRLWVQSVPSEVSLASGGHLGLDHESPVARTPAPTPDSLLMEVSEAWSWV